MKTVSNKELREFIGLRFDDNELDDFCFDYFLEVRNEFGSGLRKTEKIKDLISYCRRRDMMENLIVSLQQERGDLYQQAFAPEQPPKKRGQRLVYAPQPRNPKKVFISHSSKDAALAQQIGADLVENNYEIFITPNSIQPGEKWVPAIGRGMEESGIFLVLLTGNAVQSTWVHDEVNMAIALAHENEMRVFLLDVQECRPPIMWRQRQYISFRGDGEAYKQNVDKLLRVFDGNVSPQKSVVEVRSEKPALESKKPPIDAEQQQQEARVKSLYAQLLQAQAAGNWLNVLMLSAQVEVLIPNYRDAAALKTIALQQLQKPAAEPVVMPKIQLSKPKQEPASDRFTHEKTGMEFVRVPAGEFLYGDSKEKQTVPEFWMSKTPVTHAVYKRFIDANPKYDVPYANADWAKPYNWDKKKRMYQPDKAEHPVVLVSWYDSVAFCKWAGLELPTEEQWEKAARGTKGLKYPWDDNDPNDKLCNFNKNVGTTTAVGNYSPRGDSPYGCVDMSGNVWEWCLNKYKTPEDTMIDESGDWRVLRGGSWYNDLGAARAAYRGSGVPGYVVNNGGFRAVAARRSPSH